MAFFYFFFFFAFSFFRSHDFASSCIAGIFRSQKISTLSSFSFAGAARDFLALEGFRSVSFFFFLSFFLPFCFSVCTSKENSFSDAGPLNVTYELHRLYSTPRAKKFLEFVNSKRSPEPFLCWSALESLIEEVRDNTLESSESRSQKVKTIVEDFVVESAEYQLGLPMNVKEKMDDLYKNVSEDPEFWDGRPLLMLQREAELMLLADVREFAEKHPWSAEDSDGSHTGDICPLHVMTVQKNKLNEEKRAGVMKKLSGLLSKNSPVHRGVGSKLRRGTLKLEKIGKKATSRTVDTTLEELNGDLRPCRMTRSALCIYAVLTPGSEASSTHFTIDYELKIAGMEMRIHHGVHTLELLPVNSRKVFFVQFEDFQQMESWNTKLLASKERAETQQALLKAKREKILGLPSLPPPPKVPSGQIITQLKTPKSSQDEGSDMTRGGHSHHQPAVSSSSHSDRMLQVAGYQMAGSISNMAAAASYGNNMSEFNSMAAMYGGNTPDMGGNLLDGNNNNNNNNNNNGNESGMNVTELYGVNLNNMSTGYGVAFPTSSEVPEGWNQDGAAPGTDFISPRDSYVSHNSEGISDSMSSSMESSDGEALVDEFETDRGDFNEIFQYCVSRLRHFENSPNSPEKEKLRTDTYVELIGLAEDFVTSAVRYGQIIISEVYLPISKKTIRPNDAIGGVIGGEKFIVHNIMFKFALDSHNVFGGNDESAAKVAGLELKGLQAYMSSNTPDLCYPLMALVDYKGFRLVASSLLPLSSHSLRYGSQDAAVTVEKSLPALTQRIEEASSSLNLKLHEAGKDRVVMATAVDIEGHLGRDGRFYLLDFSRVFPPLTPNRSVVGSHLFQMFRPEFVKSFTLFPLCSDAYSNFTAGLKHAKEHAEEIDLASMELLNVSVSNFVAELIARMGEEARIAGTLENFPLTQLLHSQGINVRYLGEVVRKMGRHPFGLVVLTHMVARVVKIGFRRTLRSEMKRLRVSIDEPYRIAAKDFLNNVFSSSVESEAYWATEVPELLNSRFQLRPGNWNAFPKNLKKVLFAVEQVNGIQFNAKVAIFMLVQQALGLRVAPSLVTLLQTQPKVYAQKAVFDDVDVEDVGLRVKFLDIISNAQGFVFSKRAEEKEKEGFFEAAKSLYYRAYMGYQTALASNPNDSILLRNCALVMVKLYRLDCISDDDWENLTEVPNISLKDADPDDPLLFGAQQNFKKAIQANRKSCTFYASYAEFLCQMGQYEDAEAHYLEGLLRDPYSVPVLREYAKLLEQVDEADLALKFENRAKEVEVHITQLHNEEMKSSQEDLARAVQREQLIKSGDRFFTKEKLDAIM
jgi:tetratricopeptide (TPR) repeat protein